MKTKIALATLFILNIYNSALSNELNCNNVKKFSVDYFKCKGSAVKNKTISVGKNIINDTKDYQKKEWTKEKEKIIETKEKIIETTEKILN